MRKYYPNYSIGTDAYSDIPMVCEKYGTKAVIIGGKRALAAAADMIFACGGGKAIDTCKVLAQESKRPFFTFPTLDDMDAVITKALSGIDVRKWPYEVTPDMILDAVKKIEEVSF